MVVAVRLGLADLGLAGLRCAFVMVAIPLVVRALDTLKAANLAAR